MATSAEDIRRLLTGGDRRSIADSNKVRALVEADPSLVATLVQLTRDDDWLVTQRAVDLLEKLAHDHADWIEPHKRVFVGALADSDKWEIRLQVVRALPLFKWTPAQMKRVEAILLENVKYPQTFVRAWALDSLELLSGSRPGLRPAVERHLREFARSPSKALQARARNIRQRQADRAPTLWRCPKCHREFANRNQTHACASLHDLEHHFHGEGPEIRRMFERVRTMVESIGPVRVLPEKTRIAFQVRMSFAQITPRKNWLDGHVVLARRLESPRFRTIQTFSPRNHLHAFRISRVDEIDDELRAWLAEAYAVGRQAHLKQRSPQ
jgi:hypothetical protein